MISCSNAEGAPATITLQRSPAIGTSDTQTGRCSESWGNVFRNVFMVEAVTTPGPRFNT
ncbi:MAG TPA: hypothetical protein VGO40_16190 [Longimicrobium sp.]|jgi:hypothetical protein|nr:hypothetical protein [Longimicrobium sp.]